MKKIISLALLVITLISCGKSYMESMKGTWIPKETESGKLIISESKGTYYLKFDFATFPVVKKEDGRFVTLGEQEALFFYDKNRNIVNVNGQEFIPIENSITKQYIGKWKSADSDILFEIVEENYNFLWYITKDSVKDIYYPKKTKDGFSFTYNNEPISFIIKNNVMIDSNGHTYSKILDN